MRLRAIRESHDEVGRLGGHCVARLRHRLRKIVDKRLDFLVLEAPLPDGVAYCVLCSFSFEERCGLVILHRLVHPQIVEAEARARVPGVTQRGKKLVWIVRSPICPELSRRN